MYVYSADVLPYNVLYSTCTVQLYTSVYNIVVALQSLLLKKTKIMPIGCHVYKHETWWQLSRLAVVAISKFVRGASLPRTLHVSAHISKYHGRFRCYIAISEGMHANFNCSLLGLAFPCVFLFYEVQRSWTGKSLSGSKSRSNLAKYMHEALYRTKTCFTALLLACP